MNDLNTPNPLANRLRGLNPSTDAVTPPAGIDPQNLESEDFASVLKTMLVNVSQTQQHARQLAESFDLEQHQDLASVMIAQQKAGLAFQSTLQVRNKLVSAYQDVMNMPI